MITYTTYREDTLLDGLNMVLSNRLFINSWSLGIECRARKKGIDQGGSANPNVLLVIAFADDKPIGAIVAAPYFKSKKYDLNFFVRKPYRRRGIGTALITHVKQLLPDSNFVGSIGVRGSDKFFKSVKLEQFSCPDD